MTDRVRLTLLGGFLGAGKSTWLRHSLRSDVFEGAGVVVNEAATTSIDDLLLRGAGRLVVLAGGCVCCERRADLIVLLQALCDEQSGERRRAYDHIILETSGLADPRAIVQAVRDDTTLATLLMVGEIIVLVDAPYGLDILRREPLARAQVASADCLIVTKLDDADDATTARLIATLRLLNPAAPRFGAIRGVETALPPEDGDTGSLSDGAGECPGSPLHAEEVKLGGADWTSFSLWLSALLYARGPDIARVKGVVGTPAGRLLLQAVQGTMQSPVILPGPAAPDDGTLVVIGRGFEVDDLQRSFHRFTAACEA